MTAGNLQVAVLSAVIDRRLEFGHLCGVWSKNSPPRDRSGNPVFGDFRRQKSFVSEPEFLKIGLSGSISRLGGVPRAINSSLESERRGGRSKSRSHLIDAREANRLKKGGFAS